MPTLLIVPLFAALLAPTPAGAARWHWPLAAHRVIAPFHFDARAPFARGWRRGLRIAGPPGAAVGAACAGRVLFAGPVPGAGRTVAVRCGPLIATHLGLASLAVSGGARVRAGQALGLLPATGVMRLGARVARRPRGYVDPARLLAGGRWSPPPLGRVPRGDPARPLSPRPAIRPVAPARLPGGATASPLVLGAAWLGLGLLGSAIGAGIALRGRSRATASFHAGCPDRPSTSPRRSTT